MTTSIFLFGTDHKYQCGRKVKDKINQQIMPVELTAEQNKDNCTLEQEQKFKNEVHKAYAENDIHSIAEEMTEYGRSKYEVNETIAKVIARELDIHHYEVDLTEDERKTLKIFDDTPLLNAKLQLSPQGDGGAQLIKRFDELKNEIRERVWAARIINNNACWPVLFILGSKHIISFQRIWRHLGGNAVVLHTDFKP